MLTFIILAFIIFSPTNVTGFKIPVLTNIQELIGLAHDIGDVITGNIPFQKLFNSPDDPMKTIVKTLDQITNRIADLDLKLDNLLATIISRLPLENSINVDLRELQQHIARVDVLYDDFLQYSENLTAFEDHTINEYLNIITSAKSQNLPDILNNVNLIILPARSALNREGIVQMLLKQNDVSNPLELCNAKISFQHRLLQIYNLILITEMKALIMTAFAYKLINERKNLTSLGEMGRARSGFIIRADQYLIEFKSIMHKASREIYLCDPKTHVLGENYVEFEGLFTAYVMNEYEVGTDPCSTTCPEIATWQRHRCYKLYDMNYCTEHPCRGYIHDCGWIGGDTDMCEYPAEFRKRYDWVRSYTNGFYGQWSHCQNGTYKIVNGARWHWYRCDMCICRCEESYGRSQAYRTFSLHPQVSSIDENKVISDVRFVLKDRMIHIQVEETQLLPIGRLNRSKSAWVPLNDYIYLSNVTDGGFVQVQDGEYIPLERDKDFAFISGEQRIINIDEISGGPNYVLTGVRLNHESETMSDDGKRNISPIQLEIRVTPFNYTTGKLNVTDENPSLWLNAKTQPNLPDEYANDRKELKIGEYVYRYQSVVNSPNVKPNQYVRFIQSTAHSDAGQSTIPFMDSRPAASDNVLAYDGLGLLHRGRTDYGGIIALKPLTIDLTNYMNPVMSPKQVNFNRKVYRKSTKYFPPQDD